MAGAAAAGGAVSRRPVARIGLAGAFGQSIVRLGPLSMVRNPVMFVVWVFMLFTLALTVLPSAFPDVAAMDYRRSYFLAITVILLLTVWFSTLSESIAEAQGKAQAESLREIQTTARARKLVDDRTTLWVPASELRKGDLVAVSDGQTVPLDGDVVRGAAEIDESMMTGESAAVVRESGGDKTSVLGGSKVLRGEAVIRISADPGQGFLDRMIRLVEGASREKSPNELALTLLLSAFTVSLLMVILTFEYMVQATGTITLDLATAIALLVCLMPTTIGGLLPAIGIAAVNRVSEANIIAKSGRAVESAGDLDILILDKTGTITTGNRIAIDIVAAPGVDKAAAINAAALASAFDETPEGRSILRLAIRRGATREEIRPETSKILPFTPQRRVSGLVLADGRQLLKGAVSAITEVTGPLPPEIEGAAQKASAQGMTPLVVASDSKVVGLVVLKDVVKPGIPDRLRELRTMGIRTIMCTGDNRITARAIAREAGVDEFVAEAKPETKLELVNREKSAGRLVAMTGDGTNDAPALARADVGLAMNSGTSAAKEAGNMVDLDSDPTKIIEVVSLGKQLLITRGGVTTFSVTNDVAKYFALLPAIFVGVAGVGWLNILKLTDPALAVIATLLFNAVIIPLMIPVALGGAPFQPRTAVELLRYNLVVYGVGGLLSAFAGIWLFYQALSFAVSSPILAPGLQMIARLLGS